MLVTTNAPIYEEKSSANGKKKSPKGTFRKKLKTGFQKGYTRLNEAGAFPVIGNLLGLTTSNSGNPPIESVPISAQPEIPQPPKKMTTTTKVLVGVVVLGAIVGAYFYFKKSGKPTPNLKISK